ncbi:MAG TPA: hypothetical protein VHQ47_17665 [Phycisphaerae bacterium]|nr:hypothetical protein [Phycisphaerae bacterium]
MSVNLTPITPATGDGAYLSVSDARALAATLPLMTKVVAQTDDDLGTLLLLASIDIDAAMRYQGRKFDLTQVREFPRVAYGPPVTPLGVLIPGPSPYAIDTIVWDWNSDASAAIVPDAVKIACLFQVAWILQPQYAKRLESIRSGLAAQGIATASETLQSLAAAGGTMTGLSDRASRMLDQYRLKTGAML